tara:strand:+ start:971 stop:2107 length:1137 start_codon:yes stop_codon:yes gene_type:complete
MLNHLDLFSGIGGFALAARWVGGIRTVGFCDNEKYAQRVLAKNFPGVPIYEDVRELHPDVLFSRDGRIDFLTCGFPCQDLSVAGNKKGIEAERSGLFFEITRLSDEILAHCGTRPALCLENVPNVLAGDGGSWARTIYGELAVRGYCVEWKTLGAVHVGAPHRRLRWWAVCYMANANRNGTIRDQSKDWEGSWTEQICEDVGDSKHNGRNETHTDSGGIEKEQQRLCKIREPKGTGGSFNVAHSKSQLGNGINDHPGGCMGSESISESGNGGWKETLPYSKGAGFLREEKYENDEKNLRPGGGSDSAYENESGTWRGSIECGLGGMVNGIPDWLDEPRDIPRVTTGQRNRVSRLKGLGNAVVPLCAVIPLMRLKEILT